MANTTIYLIDSTDGGTAFAIQPRTFDGVGGVQSNTDLTLYGNASASWGERFNENFYRMLEHFAVDQTTPFIITNTAPPIPKTQTDLGVTGLGINTPVVGQQWFNKTDEKMYVYTSTGWKSTGTASTTQPTAPTPGDFWFDGSASLMKFWNGSIWVALETSAGGSFVSTAGDVMSGTLEISNNSANTQLNIHSDSGSILFMKSDSISFGASTPPSLLLYNPDNDPSVNSGNGTNWPYVRFTNRDNHYFTIEADNVFQAGTGNTILFADQLTGALVYNTGEMLMLASQISNITNNKHVATKEYVDSVAGGGGFVLATGDTMTGSLTFDTGNLIFDVSTVAKSIIFDTGNPFTKGGNIQLEYTAGGLLELTTNYGAGGIKNILTVDPFGGAPNAQFGEEVIFDKNVLLSGTTTSTGNIQMSGSAVLLDHDPIVALEAATKQYVDGQLVGLPTDGRLIDIQSIDYPTYYDVVSSTSTIIPNFDVDVVVSNAPVTFIAHTSLNIHHDATGQPTYWEVGVIGGEYASLTILDRKASESVSSGPVTHNLAHIVSGVLTQNTTYTFRIMAKNSTAGPSQNNRLNATDGDNFADPQIASTLEVHIYS